MKRPSGEAVFLGCFAGVFGVLAGVTILSATTGPLIAQPQQHQQVKITEDDPRWNCLTMGNHKCGPRYVPVDDTQYPQTWVAQVNADHPGYDPYRCLVNVGDTTVIVCQDGWVGHS